VISPERLMTKIGTLLSVTESPSVTDAYGNQVEIEVETSVHYELQQLRRDETGAPDAWQVGAWRLYLPASTNVAGIDRFVDDHGAEYEFDGPPESVWDPFARCASHIEATVRSVS